MFSTAAVQFVVQLAEPRQCESFASSSPKALPVLLGSFLRRGLPPLPRKLPYLLEPLLELLGRLRVPERPRQVSLSRSGYYDWRDRPPSKRNREIDALTEKICEIHRRSRETYGSPRVHAELRSIGTPCSRKRVARLMREAGVRGCMRGRRRGTTRRAKGVPPAEDLVKRSFATTQADKVWVAAITYVATGEGFVYLAFILDVYSRRIVGWAMESHLRTELVVDALQMAVWRRKPASGLVASFGSGSPVHGALFLEEAEGGRHQALDGKDRECPGQRLMYESFVS